MALPHPDVRTTNAVTLHDGRSVDSCSREWQIECLARWLLARPLDERREFLTRWDKRHGDRSSNELRNVMTAIHNQRPRGHKENH